MFLQKGISIVELRLSQIEISTRLEVSFHNLQFLSKVLHGLDIAVVVPDAPSKKTRFTSAFYNVLRR